MAAAAPHNAYTGDDAPIGYNGSIYRFVRFGIPTPWWAYAFSVFGVAYVACIALAARELLRRAPSADLVPTALVMATQLLWFALPPLGRELGLLSSVDPFRPDNGSFLFIWVAAGHAAQYLWITAYYAGERSPGARVRYYAKCVFAGSAIWKLRDAAERDRVLDRGIERHHRAATWQTKGAYLEKIGRPEKAMAAYAAGLRAHPDDPDLLYAAGRLHLQRGDVAAALAALERAHTIAPSDKRIELTLERAREKRAVEAPTPSGA